MKLHQIAVTLATTLLAASLHAQASQPTVKWSANDTQGKEVKVPQSDRPSVLLFVRADQPQSQQAVRLAKASLKAIDPVQAVVIVSRPQDVTGPANVAQSLDWSGPLVLDSNYAASGALNVHVWPTTVVVSASGVQLAHLAGLSNAYSTQLDAYLAFAAGKIDAAALQQRLGQSEVIGDTPAQMAARHLQVAQRLLEKGQLDDAQKEIAEGLKRQPKNAPLQVAMARVLLRQGDARQAAAIVEQIDPSAIPAWQRNLLKGKALIASEQWDAALPLLQESLKLNPEPAEAQYELGRVYAQKGDWQHASEAFRAAFEATPAGRSLAVPAK